MKCFVLFLKHCKNWTAALTLTWEYRDRTWSSIFVRRTQSDVKHQLDALRHPVKTESVSNYILVLVSSTAGPRMQDPHWKIPDCLQVFPGSFRSCCSTVFQSLQLSRPGPSLPWSSSNSPKTNRANPPPYRVNLADQLWKKWQHFYTELSALRTFPHLLFLLVHATLRLTCTDSITPD